VDNYAPSGHRKRSGGEHQADEGADSDPHGKAQIVGTAMEVGGWTDLKIQFWKKTRGRG